MKIKKTISLLLAMITMMSAFSFGSTAFAAESDHKHEYKRTIDVAADVDCEDDEFYGSKGQYTDKCTICGYSVTKEISPVKDIKLSATSYVYDGKSKKPTVTVIDKNGKKVSKSNYTVKYEKSTKNPGTYVVAVYFKNYYSGFADASYIIRPKSVTINSLSSSKKSFKITWKKQTAMTTGYQIQYSTDKNFKNNKKSVTIKNNKSTARTVKNLKSKKKYYVRIRTYKSSKNSLGKELRTYSSWSKAKTVKTK